MNIAEHLPEKFYLIDTSSRLINEWTKAFTGEDRFKIVHGDYFSVPADAMVSPANSFGHMDGGLDLAIRHELGHDIEKRVKEFIIKKYRGQMPVGCADIIATDHESWYFLVCAPTMWTPGDVSETVNAYLAFRAVLYAIADFNAAQTIKKINSLVCSGLGTGVGGMTPERCARQMAVAYADVLKQPKGLGWGEIQALHRRLMES